MKREGRQHGMVRTHRILPSPVNSRPEPRFVNRFDSPPTAGLFTKVSSKPTNHSKFTGKCGKARCAGCHVHPACKSKDKAKGTQKLRSCDVVSNYKLISWRVVDGRPGLNFSGFSATGILDDLDTDYVVDDDDDDECVDEVYEGSCGLVDGGSILESPQMGDENLIESSGIREMKGDDHDYDEKDCDNNKDDVVLSFCEVGFVWDQVEVDVDEGWCLVGEM